MRTPPPDASRDSAAERMRLLEMRLTSRDPISAAAQQQQRPASSGLREAGATPTMPTNSAGSAGSRPPLHLSDRDNRTVAELPPGAAAASPAVSGRTRSSASNGGGGGGDANNNNAADIDELKVATVFVNEAPRLRRFKASAKGRASPRQKRSSHITVVVSDQKEG